MSRFTGVCSFCLILFPSLAWLAITVARATHCTDDLIRSIAPVCHSSSHIYTPSHSLSDHWIIKNILAKCVSVVFRFAFLVCVLNYLLPFLLLDLSVALPVCSLLLQSIAVCIVLPKPVTSSLFLYNVWPFCVLFPVFVLCLISTLLIAHSIGSCSWFSLT